MFDPTAFENIKVVIEGEIYDRDLNGDIAVIDRNDWINTAKMSRAYDISFSLHGFEKDRLFALMTLEAGLENLTAELLGHQNAIQLAGCNVFIKFHFFHQNEKEIHENVQKVLEGIWGRERAIEQIVRTAPLKDNPQVENTVTVSFNRLVYEDQIDDLSNMVNYMVATLESLKNIIKK